MGMETTLKDTGFKKIEGKDTSYKFRVGDPSGGELAWDGSTLKAAGWTIGATALSDTAGVVGMSSAVTAGDDIRFWAGHATPASAPFTGPIPFSAARFASHCGFTK